MLCYFTILLILACQNRNEDTYCNKYGCVSSESLHKDTLFNYYENEKAKFTSNKLKDYWFEQPFISQMLLNLPDTVEIMNHLAYVQNKFPTQDSFLHFLEVSYRIDSGQISLLYQMAHFYLVNKSYKRALFYFSKIDKLYEGGFRDTKVWLNLITKLKKGQIKHSDLLKYIHILYGESDINMTCFASSDIIRSSPLISPAWEKVCNCKIAEKNTDSILFFVENGKKSEPDKETLGLLQIIESKYFIEIGYPKQAISCLGNIILDTNTTDKNRLMAKFYLRKLFTNR